jgi:hypothetical protein
MLVAGTFISYRHYHDRLMNRLGYSIQDDFDSLLGYMDEGEGEDTGEDSGAPPVRSGVELTQARRGGTSFVIEGDEEEICMSATRI